ncbi:hypothetical protein F5878DRAFT_708460 [Lentinula raphanica]|uniref:Arf-GAP domain-containing protein n=1 Tax=Lentinula raphanica TaxID=153919 RepID=A0AA38PDG7_9AGAR|nr:hypothetical protein F5878DRAFT_708460 [Lentinula raphanica]
MSSHKITQDRNLKALLELAAHPGNDVCADCKARGPRWASHNLGIFICVNCATIHRKIGTHITKVKSLTLDSWSKEQVERMKEMGNLNSNAIYNPNELRHPPPPMLTEDERDSELEKYIRAKYEYKKFFDKHALVASKLGPSRSSSTVLPQKSDSASASAPSVANLSRPSTAALPSTSAPTTQARSFSQPVPSPLSSTPIRPATQQQAHQPPQGLPASASASANGTGLWNDLVSLQTPSANSSLPLQYQPPVSGSLGPTNPFGAFSSATNNSMLTGMSNMNGMGYGLSSTNTGMVTGPNGLTINAGPSMGLSMGHTLNSSGLPSTNPFQQTQLSATNPFTQQQLMSSTYPPSASPYSSVPTGLSTPSITQQQPSPLFHSQPSPMMQMQSLQSPAPMFSPSPQIPNYNQNQPQFANTMQHGGGQSPLPQMSTTPQPPMSATPQLLGQQFMASPQLQTGIGSPHTTTNTGMGMSFGMGLHAQPMQQTQMFTANGAWGQQQQQPAMFATGQAQQWGSM